MTGQKQIEEMIGALRRAPMPLSDGTTLERLAEDLNSAVASGLLAEEDLDAPFEVQCWHRLPDRWALLEAHGVTLFATKGQAESRAEARAEAGTEGGS